MQEGIIYRKWYADEGESIRWQLVPPRSKREALLKEVHSGINGGHLGYKKTRIQLQRRAYWHNWDREVKMYTQRCDSCAKYHRGKLPQQGPSQSPAMVTGEPWSRISIDITGPHTVSRNGFKYILTATDVFSKWCEAWPIRNHEASTVAKVLIEQMFTKYGTPSQLLSDQGPEFEGQLMTELCRVLGIEKLRTTAYKPSTNGSIERFHRTLNSMLGKVINANQKDWDLHVPLVLSAYRATVHEAPGFTPNFLILGREVRAPIDIMLGSPVEDPEQWKSYSEYVATHQGRLEVAFKLTREHLKKTAERSKEYYDHKVKVVKYSRGDWVYYFNPRKITGLGTKWARNYTGPFLVTEVLGGVNYRLQRTASSKSFVVHVDKLKKCFSVGHLVSWLKDVITKETILDDKPRHSETKENVNRKWNMARKPLLPSIQEEAREEIREDGSLNRDHLPRQRKIPDRYLNSTHRYSSVSEEEKRRDLEIHGPWRFSRYGGKDWQESEDQERESESRSIPRPRPARHMEAWMRTNREGEVVFQNKSFTDYFADNRYSFNKRKTAPYRQVEMQW